MIIIRKKIKSLLRKKINFKLSFIICGTQKGGTTALDYYMRKHPEICMANKKEVHYFDNDRFFKSNESCYDKYHKNFDPNHMHKVIGEATPIYMYWNKSIKRIYNYNPNIKLILILRNPATRAFSHWNMEYEKHKEKDDFFVAIKKEKNREKRGIYKQSRVFSYLKRGLYSRQINKILEYFDRRQLMIIRSKELKDNPQKTLSQIAEFLQISPFGYFESKKIHSGKYKRKINENEKFFLKNFYRNEIDTLESLLNWDLSEWKNYSP